MQDRGRWDTLGATITENLATGTPERPPAPVAIVTGAGSGIGRAIARRLSGAGHRVVLAGRRMETLEDTLSGLPADAEPFAVRTDVTEPDSVAALFDAVAERAGRVDVLINSAGVFGPTAPVEDYPYDGWAAAVQTNLTGAFLCARAAFRQMIRQRPSGGRIINNGSLSAHVPRRLYMVELPLTANVLSMTVMASGTPYVGRG